MFTLAGGCACAGVASASNAPTNTAREPDAPQRRRRKGSIARRSISPIDSIDSHCSLGSHRANPQLETRGRGTLVGILTRIGPSSRDGSPRGAPLRWLCARSKVHEASRPQLRGCMTFQHANKISCTRSEATSSFCVTLCGRANAREHVRYFSLTLQPRLTCLMLAFTLQRVR